MAYKNYVCSIILKEFPDGKRVYIGVRHPTEHAELVFKKGEGIIADNGEPCVYTGGDIRKLIGMVNKKGRELSKKDGIHYFPILL